ncbi:hypothetical protein DEO72_LG5g3328 [Vigna unguiculata]|uniref:Disease resistance protein RPM1 n=1 Tax=Vigna unguiculata TaxID=3917 RepID=A0A4D6M2C0_VIGUN|nr:hypothetical protein DEO72_LG5g3328 [Vigna unguiculata]
MAAEVVGGALLSAFLQVAFDRLASPQFVDFFRGRKLDEKLLGNLNIMLHSINALADDAEQKQFTDPHVKAWLLSVKEAVFDAEDLLGEIDYELTRCQVEAGSEPQTFTDKVSNFFNSTFSSFNKKIESEMKEVLEKLKYLEQQKDALGLKNGTSYSDNKVSQKLPSSSLVVEKLPSNLHKLTKLCFLEFENTKVTEMPIRFGELKNLQVLSAVFVDKNNEFSTKHLGWLNLHGGLSINEVQNIVNPVDALEANLKNKNLVKLELKWKSDYIPDDPRKEKKVLENLQPSKNVEHLSIENYGGTEFPSWVFDNSLSNLVFLKLEDCKYCLCLPPLGLLSSLETLEIIGFDGIVSIGDEFYGNSSSSFTSLERLTFSNMKELEECERKTAAFPRLEFLKVYQCPKLKGLPDQLVKVKYLDICGSMKASCLESFDLLEQIGIISSCVSLTTFPLDFFPNLESLFLLECRNLQIISQKHTHNRLMHLTIVSCSRFESFPSEGVSAPRLRIIQIDGADNLKLLPKRMQILLPSLSLLQINKCPKVEMFPDEGLPPNVKDVSLSSFKLMASLRETLGTNTCLESLCIENIDVEFFPDEVLLPHSITSLRINNFPNLKKMHYKGLCHLSSLTLHACPNLQCLPEDGLPKSISSLEIWNCPLLEQRCQNPEGQDWKKIAHIEKLTEVVGGALLSAFLQVAFDRLASPQFVDFFRGRKLDEKLLGNLNIMLHSINALADDAEQKQFRDPHVKAWLLSVKDAVLDAEDLLGEIDYELTRCQVEAGSEPQTFTDKELPLNLHKLTKLRCLEFENTKVTKMPMHFGELKNLQVLNTVIFDRNNEFKSKHLGGLNLHGRLSINEVQNIENPFDALEANMKNKDLVELELKWESDHIPDDPRKEKKVLENLQPSKNVEHLSIENYGGTLKNKDLVDLELKWESDHIPDDPRKEKKVLENLQPSKIVEYLSIKNYGGTEFPSWVFDNSLSNLVFLRLEDCKYCLCLPPLGLLSSLKTLEIIGFDGIVSIGDEFYGNSSSSFTSLESLKFSKMKELEECERKTAAFPRLKTLSVYQCPKLKGLPDQLVNVKNLSIIYSMEASCLERCEHTVSHNSLEALTFFVFPIMNISMSRSFDLLEQIRIFGSCDSLTTFPLDFFPNLKDLSLFSCRNLQMISQDHTHTSLEILSIRSCSRFDSFPSEGLSAPQLWTIDIDGAENLKLLPKRIRILLPSLYVLNIINCPKVEMFPDGGLPPYVEQVSLSSFKLIASLKETLGTNTCLQSLSIKNMDVEFFPDEVLLPHSITSLKICRCPNLKKMEYKGLCHLSYLKLSDCPNLQCLPEDGLPKSISSLKIWNCPLLEQRCQNPEGQDWNKIAHIEDLIVRS